MGPLLALLASAALAAPHPTRDAALGRLFGTAARFEPRTLYLTPAQVESVRTRARAPFATPRLTCWVATRHDSLLGRAYLDTYTVRTMPATLLVAVAPGGQVAGIEILAFHEPEDYLPPRRWLDRFVGQRLSRRLRPGDAVDGISGATLSARAVADAVRRALALDALLHGGTP